MQQIWTVLPCDGPDRLGVVCKQSDRKALTARAGLPGDSSPATPLLEQLLAAFQVLQWLTAAVPVENPYCSCKL